MTTMLTKLRFLLFVPILFVLGCEGDPNEEVGFGSENPFGAVTPNMPIQEIVAQTFVLQSFEAMLVATKVAGEMKSPPYTVFAPWDSAFEALPYWKKISRNRAWYGHFRDLALGHLHQGNLPKTQLADNMNVVMLNDDVGHISIVNQKPRVDGYPVIASIAASDGYLYMLDKVREPKWTKRTILDIISSDERFSILAQILSHPSLSAKREELRSTTAGLTFFAPTNEALQGFDINECEEPECSAMLKLLVGNHLVGAVVPRMFTATQKLATQSGASLSWSFDTQSVTCTNGDGSFEKVGIAGAGEELALNGIVQPVNRLLCTDNKGTNSPGDFPRDPFVIKHALIIVGEHSDEQIQILKNLLDPNEEGIVSFYNENSAGFEAIEGRIFGPYPYTECFNPANEKNGCASLDHQAIQLAAAEWAGVPVSCPAEVSDSLFKNFIREFLITGRSFVYKAGECEFRSASGVGTPGDPNDPTGYNAIFNYWQSSSQAIHTFVHEFGHSLGMRHTFKAKNCDMSSGADVIPGNFIRNHCERLINSRHSVMGNAGTIIGQSISAPQKRYMGWLRNCEDITAGGGRSIYRLNPIDGQCGLRSVKVPVPGMEDAHYFIEYRSPNAGTYSGYRTDVDDERIKAVLIHFYQKNDPNFPGDNVYLMTSDAPGYPPFGHQGPLRVGDNYTLPGGVAFRLIKFDDESDTAVVEVTSPQPQSTATCNDGTALLKNSEEIHTVQCGPVSSSTK